MKCEICHKADAQVAIHRKIDGVDCELYVCKECANPNAGTPVQSASQALNIPKIAMQAPTELITELLKQMIGSGIESASVLENPTAEKFSPPCPSCGMTAQEFRRRERLGCPNCYKHFFQNLAPIIHDMHKGASHVGKIPPHAPASDEKQSKLPFDGGKK